MLSDPPSLQSLHQLLYGFPPPADWGVEELRGACDKYLTGWIADYIRKNALAGNEDSLIQLAFTVQVPVPDPLLVRLMTMSLLRLTNRVLESEGHHIVVPDPDEDP